jgi:hypothetical protein
VAGLDGCDVGIEEDRSDAGLLEGLEGLRACAIDPIEPVSNSVSLDGRVTHNGKKKKKNVPE